MDIFNINSGIPQRVARFDCNGIFLGYTFVTQIRNRIKDKTKEHKIYNLSDYRTDNSFLFFKHIKRNNDWVDRFP